MSNTIGVNPINLLHDFEISRIFPEPLVIKKNAELEFTGGSESSYINYEALLKVPIKQYPNVIWYKNLI